MTLSAHAVVGAAVANIFPSHPVLAFGAGFASHFLLDAIPHWDYHLNSVDRNPDNPMKDKIIFNKNFITDLFKMGTDAILGVIIVLFSFGLSDYHLVWAPIWGMVGAMLPDALQLVYLRWKHQPMISLHKFHTVQIHNKTKFFENRPVLGILWLAFVILFAITISKLMV